MAKRDKQQQTLFTNRVLQSPDGKFRWACEIHLLTNYSILLHLLKVFTVIVGVLVVFIAPIRCFGDTPFVEILRDSLIILLIGWGIALLSYVIYVCIRGFRFTVCYTMDEKQLHEQFTPARLTKDPDDKGIMGIINALGSRPGLPGFGFVYATGKSTSTMPMDRIRSVKPRRFLGHIKISLGLDSLRVYVPDEDFDFVLDYLLKGKMVKK